MLSVLMNLPNAISNSVEICRGDSVSRPRIYMKEQLALRDLCIKLHDKGAMFMLSNSDTSSTLYQDPVFEVDNVRAPRFVNSRADHRGAVDELLITNF